MATAAQAWAASRIPVRGLAVSAGAGGLSRLSPKTTTSSSPACDGSRRSGNAPPASALLGPVSEDDRARAGWTQHASRVEAYREEWGIEPDQLLDPPRDAAQHREWDTAVHTIELINRLNNLQLDRGRYRGLGPES